MIIVRNTFLAKPGCASKLAALVKNAASIGKLKNLRVLTDMTGDFNRVIMEHEVEDLNGVAATMQKYAKDEAVRSAMQGYTDLYVTGSREVLQTM